MDTVDRYQGMQRKIIILSCVRSRNTENNVFLSEPGRLCVATTRCTHGLIVIGNDAVMKGVSDDWKTVVEQITAQNGELIWEIPDPGVRVEQAVGGLKEWGFARPKHCMQTASARPRVKGISFSVQHVCTGLIGIGLSVVDQEVCATVTML